ncbi:CDP-glucose 4,6-dehydratase [Rhizobium sp. SG_E_25_P2]|uniref:CDP-glucose 4,6-dehydratase n=1 Tax=Rhizobium sp. SG_E_25_P2 TaxID=2879942 RepID=UPI002473EDB7|nr:CDP-glucose 4,6-dehydratase [Rhizobium sp. SG_E_25_P2]MDH6264902.1 CDP-glucose 4,6-dehydratase [Rhizobium sp. SG_E_25_P2]
MNRSFWRGKRVLLTGHTGFKGAWLAFWLKRLGAEVGGLALGPAQDRPALHLLLGGAKDGRDILDIRHRDAVRARILAVNPQIILHLAAQPLVRAGYRDPLETFEINVQGTANLLDAARMVEGLRVVVSVTTDKVYENAETGNAFAEADPLGGHDPYSASKAAADIVTTSYRRSYFLARGVGIATARAGNVIGGGDWADDRLIPDAIRAFGGDGELDIRRPRAVRPWQHVLEPLHGYLLLAERLWRDPEAGPAYNFGPDSDNATSVRDLLERSATYFDLARIRWGDGAEGPHEAGLLTLDSSRARGELGFAPRFDLDETIARTWSWYRGLAGGVSAETLCGHDVDAFEARLGHPSAIERRSA